MKPALTSGLRCERTITVDASLTVPQINPAFAGLADMPPVFATSFFVAAVEWTCIEALAPYLEPGERTVGTHMELSHTAATPIGMAVTIAVELEAVEGRKLRFRFSARDDSDPIGGGVHERAVIDAAKFLSRLEGKVAAGAKPRLP